MDLIEQGSNKRIRLNDRQHFLASGGEGKIYAKDKVAYKVFTDPKDMIPVAKIKELSVLKHPNIISPQSVLLNTKKKPVGFSMRYLKDTYALCQAFTKVFKNRVNLTSDKIVSLVDSLFDIVSYAHKHKILIVDINELNFLLTKDLREVCLIDINSCQTPSFPATAIMDVIRDRHSIDSHGKPRFTEDTDWFSAGIVTFQLFIGIHPYKGRHPSFGKKDIDGRMKKNISVFNPKVSVPSVCFPFDVIPQGYRDWYKAMFEKGHRGVPPAAGVVAISVKVTPDKVVGTDMFEIHKMFKFDGDIVHFQPDHDVVVTTKHVYINNSMHNVLVRDKSYIAVTPCVNHPVLVQHDYGKLMLFDLVSNEYISSDISCDDFICYGGRAYFKRGESIREVTFVEIGEKITHAVGSHVANVLEQSSQMFDGVVVQNLLGAYYVSLFPSIGKHYQVRIKELDSYRIIDAKFDSSMKFGGGVLMLVGEKKGKYDRFVFRFDEQYATYDKRLIENVSVHALNFVVLDTNVCACINEDEELELFSAKKDSKEMKQISDPAINSNMVLFTSGTKLLFATGDTLYQMSSK